MCWHKVYNPLFTCIESVLDFGHTQKIIVLFGLSIINATVTKNPLKWIQFWVVLVFFVFVSLAEYYKVKMLPFQKEATLLDVVAGGLTPSVMVQVSRPSWLTGHRMCPCPSLWVQSACLGETGTARFPE